MLNISPIYIQKTFFIKAEDGLKLRYRFDFPSEWKKGDALILLLSGRAECLDKYDRVTTRFLERGFAVLRKDFRGQGGSERMLKDSSKGYISDFNLYLNDIDLVIKKLIKPLSPSRFILVGHSMGAHLAMRYLLKNEEDIDAAILISPMFSILRTPLGRSFAFLISRLALFSGFGESYIPDGGPFFSEAKFKNNGLTSDYEHFFRFKNFLIRYPQFQLGDPSFAWVRAALISIRELWKELEANPSSLPIMICSGGRDKLVGIKEHRKASSLLKKSFYCFIRDAFHEIFMERAELQAELWFYIDDFLKNKL